MHPLDRQLNQRLKLLFDRAKASQESRECYKILDEALQMLAQEAQKYPFGSQERRIVITLLSEIMLPGLWDKFLTPQERSQRLKSTDDVARQRLGGVKKSLSAKYGNLPINPSFNYCWDEALGNTQKEFLKKIDIYQRGVDFVLFDKWQSFRKQVAKLLPKDELTLTPACQDFIQAVFAWQRRLERRLTKRQDCNPAILQKLTETCQTFGNAILPAALLGDTRLDEEWHKFCDEAKRYYRPKTVWNWFAMLLIYRFKDIIIREGRIQLEAADAPVNAAEPESGSKWEVITKKIPKREKLNQEILEVIEEDRYGIFDSKHINKQNCTDITFRAITLCKNRQPPPNLTEIQAHFDNRVNAQTTISPFYTRCLRYFKPILKEFTSEDTSLPLPPEVLQQIEDDSDGKFENKRMSKDSPVTFRSTIQTRREVTSWKLAANKLKVEVKDIIGFYLDCLHEFKLIPPDKTRTRRNNPLVQPNPNLGDN